MKKGKVLFGALAGAGVGALLGILFAPLTGKDTRRKISKTSKDYADTLKHTYDDALDSLTRKFKNLKEEASVFAHKTRVKEEKLKKGNGVNIG